MASQIHDRDISKTLEAARHWIESCLVGDGSLFSADAVWSSRNLAEIASAFIEHPDFGDDDFLTKLKKQLSSTSAAAHRLAAEMLWALVLFPSNMKPATKRQQIREVAALGDLAIPDDHPLLSDDRLKGIGSGGPGFNTYRPNELEFLIVLTGSLKSRTKRERETIFKKYETFVAWINQVPRKGNRQFRHMLRYFAFPDLVERISSDNDRRRILIGFGIASIDHLKTCSDFEIDKSLLALRRDLEKARPSEVIDFYSPTLKHRWSNDQTIKTADGEVTVIVPTESEDPEDDGAIDRPHAEGAFDPRPSYQIQAKLAEIGAKIGLRVWIPRNDRGRVRELISSQDRHALLEDLPLNNEQATLNTIEQIDVIWLRGRAIVRAFEVEHTTSVYSGLLRMADLLALQPNLEIQLHIVAPLERRDKVFKEMQRPVFSLFSRKPLSKMCTFISYDSVNAIQSIGHLQHVNETIVEEFEERAEEI